MTALQGILSFLIRNGWMIAAALCTIGYLVVLIIMARKVLRDRALPEAERPGPRPLFYLGQAYLAFVWPVPLFLVLEAFDLLTPTS
ncbi:MAG: hypothetical protein HN793_05850 [Rhodospirillaceae bacterium]|jgi:hypothetical protein|nr:hypothetical protein [Rhodospirillaceae bacterium]MBT5564526.1 hypothetical protein [Rhodospirillaceae bacterium]MBT6087944.1 hypothetical protein [Rhodospirillaceae bacterium]MBT7450333.1 hypothetical protein [Rhodospirillaceae bacterium]